MENRKLKILAIIFFTIFISSSVVYYFRSEPYIRPEVYLCLLSALVLIVAFQILLLNSFEKLQIAIILFEITLIPISFTLTQQALYKSVLGRDPWFHWVFVEEIVRTGFIPSYSDIPIPYVKMPNFHLIIVLGELITGIGYKWAQYLFSSLPTLILLLFVAFLYSKKLFDIKTALLAVLFVSIADNVLDMTGKNIIPNSMGVALAFLIFYIVMFKGLENSKNFLISAFIGVALVFMHTVSSTFLIYQLAVITLISWIFRDKNCTRLLNFTLLIIILALFEWAIYSGFYFGSLISIFESLFLKGFDIERYEARTPVSFAEVIFARLGMILYFAVGGLVILSVLMKYHRDQKKLLSSIITAGMFFGIFGVFAPAISGIAHRFWYYGEVLTASFLGTISRTLSKSRKLSNFLRILFLVFIAVLSFLMFGSSTANDDNPITPWYSQRTGWYDSEISAGIFAISYEGEIPFASDFDYSSNLGYLKTVLLKSGKKENVNRIFLKTFEEVNDCNCIFIFRSIMFKDRLFYLSGGQIPHLPLEDLDLLKEFRAYKSVIFNNENVLMIMESE